MNVSKRNFAKSPLGPNPLNSVKKAEIRTKVDTAIIGKYSDSMVLAVFFVTIIY